MLKEYHIAAGVKAFSTTRKGGVSTGNYGEFNINEYCGDEPENIARNRKLLADELGIATDRIIMPHQVHGVEVRQIAAEYLSMPENIRKMVLEGVDAVMTDQTGVCVGVSTADCIPILLYDEEHHAVAAIHAGWRGTLARIVHKTLQEMAFAYQSAPKKLKAVIGPGISLDNFEVGDEVYEAFEQAAFPMGEIAEQRPNAAFHVSAAERDRMAEAGNIEQPLKWHINLPLCNKQILIHCGVPEANIQDCGICTYAHSDEFFSARKLGTESGRIYTAILMEK
ncbi:MAG TPA: peptidoglycan editing factor PgeF [Prevotella sp.]|nr:peptidoglycan editing factor PgeF [uncultured Prevotella sp.]HBF05581.1 peptidoglycan editing factor PgeF [Candidatus Segatella violae]